MTTSLEHDLNSVRLASVWHPTQEPTDQLIRLRGPKSRRLYPEPLRRIVYRDLETGKRLVFLANITGLPVLVIAKLYQMPMADRVVLQVDLAKPIKINEFVEALGVRWCLRDNKSVRSHE